MKQDLHIFTGKGGVGKSVLALAYAKRLAQSGEKTLLVELGDASYYDELFSIDVSYGPSKLSDGLFVSRFSGADCLKEYLTYLIKVKKLADLFFDNKVMRAFIDAAPGLKELSILGKLTSGLRGWGPDFPYRHIVVDAYSSGHFLALLKAPLGLAQVIDMGPMGEQTRSIFKALKGEHVHYKIVTLPEEMPTSEGIELANQTESLTGKMPHIYLNRYFKANQLAVVSKKWEALYNEHMIEVQTKMQNSITMLENTNYTIEPLPFIFEVSPLKVAEQLSAGMEVKEVGLSETL